MSLKKKKNKGTKHAFEGSHTESTKEKESSKLRLTVTDKIMN